MMKRELNKAFDFPLSVEIQTNNFCNSKCSVCPYPYTIGLEPRSRMSSELLYSILDQCASNADTMESVIPYFNNEPFSDPRLLEILRYIKNVVRTPVEISSNLNLARAETLQAIVSEDLVSLFRCSVFGAYPLSYEKRMHGLKWDKMERNLNLLITLLKENCSSMLVEVIMVGADDLSYQEVTSARELWDTDHTKVKIFGYLDRAGSKSNKNILPTHQQFSRVLGCDLNRPFERMAITWDGLCVLCSQDWTRRCILGNANEASLKEIWTSAPYVAVRADVSGGTCASKDMICRDCKLAIME